VTQQLLCCLQHPPPSPEHSLQLPPTAPTSVTPLALKLVTPPLVVTVAFTQVLPSALTCTVSPTPGAALSVPVTTCAAVLVMKSLADVPVSALNPTPLSVIVGAVLSILITRSSVVATFPATSVASRRLDRQLLTIELSNWCVRLHTTQFRHTELARYIRRPSKHLHRLACRNRKACSCTCSQLRPMR
jgi:hypothetical protein